MPNEEVIRHLINDEGTYNDLIDKDAAYIKDYVGPYGEEHPPHIILRQARLDAGLSLAQMGERINYNAGLLSKVENGRAAITTEVLEGYESVVGHTLGIAPTGVSNKKPKGETEHEMALYNEAMALYRDAENSIIALAAGQHLEMMQYIRLGMFFKEVGNMLEERRRRI